MHGSVWAVAASPAGPAMAGSVSKKIVPPGSFKSGVIFDLRLSFFGCHQQPCRSVAAGGSAAEYSVISCTTVTMLA